MERDKYHHGNLKQALIKESLNQLYLVGVEKFSFRTIAKNLGVVSSAPYNHFVNKEELFKELISIGTKSLMQKMHEENPKSPSHAAHHLHHLFHPLRPTCSSRKQHPYPWLALAENTSSSHKNHPSILNILCSVDFQ